MRWHRYQHLPFQFNVLWMAITIVARPLSLNQGCSILMYSQSIPYSFPIVTIYNRTKSHDIFGHFQLSRLVVTFKIGPSIMLEHLFLTCLTVDYLLLNLLLTDKLT